MAEKIRLGESTVSGRLVSDPMELQSRRGRQVTMFRMTRVAEQSNGDVQNLGLEEIEVAIARGSKIAASKYASLEVGDLVTVRGDSVIDTVQDVDGGVELRQRMVAKELTSSLAAYVAHNERPLPWRVHQIDEDGRHALHIPVEELRKDPELVNELVEYVPVGQYLFTEEILEARKEAFASDLEAAEAVSRQYSPTDIERDVRSQRYIRSSSKVESALKNLPGGPISILPEDHRVEWQMNADELSARTGLEQDAFIVRHELSQGIATYYGPDEVATWLDHHREHASTGQSARADRSAQDVAVHPSKGRQGRDIDHVMMQQYDALPTRPGADGPGL